MTTIRSHHSLNHQCGDQILVSLYSRERDSVRERDCRYFDKNLTEVLHQTYIFLSNPLNLIGCHGNRKAKFAKKYSKIISTEAIRGMKLKLWRPVYNISLYKNIFLLPLLMYFRYNDNLKFPLTYNGNIENWHLLLFHCRQKFFKNVYWIVLYIILVLTSQFDWLSWQLKG